jgi:hypothetical protein
MHTLERFQRTHRLQDRQEPSTGRAPTNPPLSLRFFLSPFASLFSFRPHTHTLTLLSYPTTTRNSSEPHAEHAHDPPPQHRSPRSLARIHPPPALVNHLIRRNMLTT